MATAVSTQRPNYGIDAPGVLRNLFVFGALCILAGILVPVSVHLPHVDFRPKGMLFGAGTLLLVEALLYLLYVKRGKFSHRDFLLAQHTWKGDESVLDVGCGRGLLLIGAAKRLKAIGGHGRATGIDIWSTVDLSGNSVEATQRNIDLEGVTERCQLVSGPAQTMPFADASFDVIVSNLCLHNIYDKATRLQALEQIGRVLKPGGVAVISDYKLTGEYTSAFRDAGYAVQRTWGSVLTTFPPLRVVIARKPMP